MCSNDNNNDNDMMMKIVVVAVVIIIMMMMFISKFLRSQKLYKSVGKSKAFVFFTRIGLSSIPSFVKLGINLRLGVKKITLIYI